MNNIVEEPPLLELRDIRKSFGSHQVLKGISLKVFPGEFLTFLGPSGCGKTTTLRLIAGLEEPDSGSVHLAGRDVTLRPPYERDVHTVFQNYALFPHCNVFENVAFSLRLMKLEESAIQERVREALALVKLSDYEKRPIHQLSGGQQQRIALARSLVGRPSLLLLDEPLGALDLKLRLQMQLELKSIQKQTGITFIYVTHDQEEAMTLSDRIAVFDAGEIVQLGTPKHIYEHPASSFVADFIGVANVFEAVVAGGKDGRTRLLLDGELELPITSNADMPIQIGDQCSIAIRPERIEVRFTEPLARAPGLICFPAYLKEAVYLGASTQLILSPSPNSQKTITVVAMNSTDALNKNGHGSSKKVWLNVRMQDILFLNLPAPAGTSPGAAAEQSKSTPFSSVPGGHMPPTLPNGVIGMPSAPAPAQPKEWPN